MKHSTLNFGTRFFNLLTIVGALLFSVGIWAQPVIVEVPNNCEVVVAGTGGTTGFGGKVGDGGIVIMPDPGSGSFTIIPNGATLLTFSLLGDLSFDDNSLNQSGSATTAATPIYSYNKNRRTESEGVPPSTLDLARSKGRVFISYDATPCGGRIQFDIYKKYSNTSGEGDEYVPQIIGPTCWLADSTYTYSVDQIASDNLSDGIGIDSYYWTIVDKDNNLIYDSEVITTPPTYPNSYTSADKSSITTKVPNNLNPPYTITCCFGRANNWDGDGIYTNPAGNHTTCVQFFVGAEPVEPIVLINGVADNCVSASDNSFTATIDVNDPNYNPNYNYSWSSDNPVWTFSPATGTSTTVNNVDGGVGKVILSVENTTCVTSKDFEYQVNRSFDAPDVSIISDASDCLEKGTNVTFSIDGPSGVQSNSTDWTFTPGGNWAVVSSNGTNSVITVTVPSSASGTYNVSASSTECSSSSVDLTVNIKPDAPTFVTTGGDSPTCVDYDASSPVTYTVSPVPGATGYHWTFPPSWSPSSTTTSQPTVNVTPATDGNSDGTVTVVVLGDNSCDSAPANYQVYYNPIKPDDIDNVLCWNFGYDADNNITVQNAPNPFFGTYNVTSSPSGLFNSTSTDPLTGEITLHTDANAPAGAYILTITHETGGSCTELGTNVTINFGGNNPGEVTFSTNGTCDFYTGPQTTSAWFVDGVEVFNNPPNVLIIPGGTLILCGTGTQPTSVCASVEEDGCNTMVCSPIVGSASTMNRPGGNTTSENEINFNEFINVFPNPNDGNFTIEVPEFEDYAKVDMYDINGKLIKSFKLSEGRNLIKENVSMGSYILLFSIDNKRSVRKIEILK